ncbi:MAG: TetR/AcrR family transcriptional regulator [Solirubrobacteraceae bacterium]|nr:TetR/AcrR family transcriptional regulator [Solirubrobacteraceae bacterium]
MRTPPTNTQLGQDSRRETTERRILESAAELIASGIAWNALGIRQIAERAEISRTAFYDFFASKNEVLEHLITGLHDDLATFLTEDADDGRTLLDLVHLRTALARLAAYSAHNGAVYLAFLDATGDDPRLGSLFDELAEVYAGMLVTPIEAARESQPGAPQTPDAAELARVLLAMTERTMLLLLRPSEPAIDREERLEALAQVWERAVYGAAVPS